MQKQVVVADLKVGDFIISPIKGEILEIYIPKFQGEKPKVFITIKTRTNQFSEEVKTFHVIFNLANLVTVEKPFEPKKVKWGEIKVGDIVCSIFDSNFSCKRTVLEIHKSTSAENVLFVVTTLDNEKEYGTYSSVANEIILFDRPSEQSYYRDLVQFVKLS